jgi:hypothetical protein
MCDNIYLIQRIETTTNGASFFKHYREVGRRNGIRIMKCLEIKGKLSPWAGAISFCRYESSLFAVQIRNSRQSRWNSIHQQDFPDLIPLWQDRCPNIQNTKMLKDSWPREKIVDTYSHYLTKILGLVLATCFRLKQVLLVPEFAHKTVE